MAYEVNKTDGNLLINLQEGEVDTTYGLYLLGKNYLGYGELIAENFVRLLENFSNSSPPPNPIPGQLWFRVPPTDSTGSSEELVRVSQLRVYHGDNTWKPLAQMFTSRTAPNTQDVGDLWFDTVNQSLFIWDGSSWILLNSLYGPVGKKTGYVFNEKIVDTSGNKHPCIKCFVDGVLTMIISSDAAYTPAPSAQQDPVFDYTAFCGANPDGSDASFGEGDYNDTGTIGKGINLNASSDFKIRGVAVEAEFADVAEIYIGDAAYEPGTLVSLGGAAEITATAQDADPKVFGVVSHRPAYLMNARRKNDKNALPIAVAGRIPLKVIGPVSKGDRLVASDTPGVARCAKDSDPYWSVIGRSLQNYDGTEVVKIQATVGNR